MSKFLSVFASTALVILLFNLLPAPAADQPEASQTPIAVFTDGQSTIEVPVEIDVVKPLVDVPIWDVARNRNECSGGSCNIASAPGVVIDDSSDASVEQESAARRPVRRVAAALPSVVGRAVCIPAKAVRCVFARRR